MDLTEGEYCQFSLDSQVQILEEFGIKMFENMTSEVNISVFNLFKFKVAVFRRKNKVVNIEIMLKFSISNFYKGLQNSQE